MQPAETLNRSTSEERDAQSELVAEDCRITSTLKSDRDVTRIVYTHVNRTSKTVSALSVVLLGAVGFGFYQSRQLKSAKTRIAALEMQLANPRAKTAPSGNDSNPVLDTTRPYEKLTPNSRIVGDDIHTRVSALKDILVRLPEQGIPELKLATDSDWYSAADGKLESEEDYRRAMAKIRSIAEARFAKALQPALREYLTANDGRFPASTSELQTFAGTEIDAEMLRRYHVAPASDISNVKVGGDKIITQVSVVDREYDSLTVIGPRGYGTTNATMPILMQEMEVVRPAIKAYKTATGNGHTDILHVLPYASTPEQAAVIRKWSQNEKKKTGP
jgi:hypothetical protein